jgi:hypothetical protein
MLPAGFEATISASEQPQIYAFDRTATVIGNQKLYHIKCTMERQFKHVMYKNV